MPIVEPEEVFLVRQVEPDGQQPQNLLRHPPAFPVEFRREGPEAWENGLGEPDVGLVRVLLAADFVTFLFSCQCVVSRYVSGSRQTLQSVTFRNSPTFLSSPSPSALMYCETFSNPGHEYPR